jgi:hypothetical protein
MLLSNLPLKEMNLTSMAVQGDVAVVLTDVRFVAGKKERYLENPEH